MKRVVFASLFWLHQSLTPFAHDNTSEKTDSSTHEKDRHTVIADYEHNLSPLIIPVIKGEKVVAYLRLVIKLVTKDHSSFDEYRPFVPRIVDAIFSDLFATLCDQWLPYKDPAPDSILKRIQKIIPKIVGDENLMIFITSFYFHRIENKDEKKEAS